MSKKHDARLIELLEKQIKEKDGQIQKDARDNKLVEILRKQLTEAGMEPKELPLFGAGTMHYSLPAEMADMGIIPGVPYNFKIRPEDWRGFIGSKGPEPTPYDRLWSKK